MKPTQKSVVRALICVPILQLLSCIGIPSGGDADEARWIRNLLVERHKFPAVRTPDHAGDDCAAVYWRPLSYRSEFLIIGITDKTEQDQIVTAANDIRRETHTKPILLQFFANPEGHSGSDPSEIRRVMVRDPRPREVRFSNP